MERWWRGGAEVVQRWTAFFARRGVICARLILYQGSTAEEGSLMERTRKVVSGERYLGHGTHTLHTPRGQSAETWVLHLEIVELEKACEVEPLSTA